MTKTVIWGTIVLAVTITAGIFAFIPIQEASSAAGGNPSQLVRDNIVVTGLSTPASTGAPIVGAIVLLDNAGIGGTSDVEVTWTKPFTDGLDCRLITVGGTPSATPGQAFGAFDILGDDTAFSTGAGVTSVAHNDVIGTQAILLVDFSVDVSDGCSLGTDYVSITTVASNP